MREISAPSPATALSLIALFVALGGTGYAATALKKNSVGAQQIRANAVGASEIRAGAVGASEVKNNSLGGDDINESRLGIVPSAVSAQNAGSAQSADSAGKAGLADRATSAADADRLGGKVPGDYLSASAVQRVFLKMAGGEKRTIFAHGTLSLEAECVHNGTINNANNVDGVVIRIVTTKAGATFVSDVDDLEGGANPADFLNPDSPAADREVYRTNAPTGTVRQEEYIDALSAIDPDGKAFVTGGGESIVSGVNLLGADCVVGGTFFPLS